MPALSYCNQHSAPGPLYMCQRLQVPGSESEFLSSPISGTVALIHSRPCCVVCRFCAAVGQDAALLSPVGVFWRRVRARGLYTVDRVYRDLLKCAMAWSVLEVVTANLCVESRCRCLARKLGGSNANNPNSRACIGQIAEPSIELVKGTARSFAGQGLR